MHRIVAMEGAYFRVGVAVVPAAPRHYRERRACAPCSWAAAVIRLGWCLLLASWCHARRGLMRAYLRALVSGVLPAGALPVLSRVVWWTPPAPRRRWAAVVLLVDVLALLLAGG